MVDLTNLGSANFLMCWISNSWGGKASERKQDTASSMESGTAYIYI